ncbi:MAG: hypothetical protein ACREEM_40490, partial [Blastocatellia bacterium]
PAGGGIQGLVLVVGRPGLNNPPPAGGGIRDRRNSTNLGNDKALKRRATLKSRCGGWGIVISKTAWKVSEP